MTHTIKQEEIMKSIQLSKNHIHKSPWNGYDIQDQYVPLHEGYLFNILGVIQSALRQYPKILVIRFDLRLPEGFDKTDTAVISRFFDSLKSQIHEDYLRHVSKGKYVAHCRLRYVWAKELGYRSDGLHYHVAILLSYKRFCLLGNFDYDEEPDLTKAQKSMVWRIRKAWVSATYQMAKPSLVHFCANGKYVMDRKSPELEKQKRNVFYRLSYLAKVETKETVEGRTFGCSRN